MILDRSLKIFDNGLAIDATPLHSEDCGTGNEFVLDIGAPGSPLDDNDFTIGEHKLALIIEVTTEISGVGTGLVELISSTAVTLETADKVHCSRQLSANIATTPIAVGVYKIGIPANWPAQRYVGCRITASTSFAAGAMNAYLVRDVQEPPLGHGGQ